MLKAVNNIEIKFRKKQHFEILNGKIVFKKLQKKITISTMIDTT